MAFTDEANPHATPSTDAGEDRSREAPSRIDSPGAGGSSQQPNQEYRTRIRYGMDMFGDRFRQGEGRGSRRGGRFRKYNPNAQSKELVGVLDPSVPVSADTDLSADFTATIDTTIKADAAKLSLSNNTGDTVTVFDFGIKAKPVWRLSGDEGWLHDGHIDYEDIYKNGEKLFELGNNYIAQSELVNKLADFWKKRTFNKLHEYEITLKGTRYHFNPGDWYTLQIGGAGEPEYIDSAVECVSVMIQRSWNQLGSTVAVFREVYEDWKFDSNATARLLARGDVNRLGPRQNVITVGADNTVRAADVACDGTNDYVEIQAAIDQARYTGQGVMLLNGTFNVGNTTIDRKGVWVVGESIEGTILQTDQDINMWTNSIDGGGLSTMTLEYTGGTEVEKYLIYETQNEVSFYDLYIDHAGCLGVSLSGSGCKFMKNDLTGGKDAIIGEITEVTPLEITSSYASECYSTHVVDDLYVWVRRFGASVPYSVEVNLCSWNSTDGYTLLDQQYAVTGIMVGIGPFDIKSIGQIEDGSYCVVVAVGGTSGPDIFGAKIYQDAVSGDWTLSCGSFYSLNNDSCKHPVISVLSSTKMVISYNNDTDSKGSSCTVNRTSGGVVFTWDGFPFPTEYQTSSDFWVTGGDMADSTHFVLTGIDISDSYKLKAVVGTVDSDDAITYGSYIDIDSGNSALVTGDYLAVDIAMLFPSLGVITYRDYSDSNKGKLVYIKFDEDYSASVSDEQEIVSSAVDNISVHRMNSSNVFIGYTTDTATDVTAMVCFVPGYGLDVEYSERIAVETGSSTVSDFRVGERTITYGYGSSAYFVIAIYSVQSSRSLDVAGNNNQVNINRFYGTANKFIEDAISVRGAEHDLSNNQIYGSFDDNKHIKYGIILRGDTSHVNLSSNIVKNVLGTAIVNQGTNNKITNINARNNGNLIDRGDCESETAPMVRGETTPATTNATFSRDSGKAYEGTYSYKHTKTAAAGSSSLVNLVDVVGTSDMHGLIAGLTYKLSMYIYIPSSGGPDYDEVSIHIYDYDSGWASTETVCVDSTDAWQSVEVERTIREDATGTILRIDIDSAAANNEYIYVDHIRLEPVGTHNEHDQQYVDYGTGTQLSGNSWNGAFIT